MVVCKFFSLSLVFSSFMICPRIDFKFFSAWYTVLPTFICNVFHVLNIVVVQSLSCVQFFATSWTVALQAPLSSTTSRSLLKFMFRYAYIMECYSAMKRNKIESFVVVWMNLELIIQSVESKNKYGILMHIYEI